MSYAHDDHGTDDIHSRRQTFTITCRGSEETDKIRFMVQESPHCHDLVHHLDSRLVDQVHHPDTTLPCVCQAATPTLACIVPSTPSAFPRKLDHDVCLFPRVCRQHSHHCLDDRCVRANPQGTKFDQHFVQMALR